MSLKELPPTISFDEHNIDTAIENIYDTYKNELMDKSKRPRLFGKFIYIDCGSWIENKPEMFWHLISLSETEKFNILPCNNDKSMILCKGNCLTGTNQIILKNGKKRNLCFYRATRINWICKVIEFANDGYNNIEKWIRDNRIYIRFQQNEIDYILIFDIRKSYYYFVSAFPVFYINSKRNYCNDYNNYIKNKNR